MNNTKVLEEFFIWEENNSTDLNQNLLKNEKQDNSVITIETKTDSMPKDWRDITDPKLRQKAYKKAWYESNKDKVKSDKKTHYELNKDKVKKYQKDYYQSNKDKVKKYKKNWYDNNKDKVKSYCNNNKDKVNMWKKTYNNKTETKAYKKEYRKLNKDWLYKQTSEWKIKNKNNIQYKLSCLLRNRLNGALNARYKSGSAVRDLGCSIEELVSYLESKFQPGMTWDNHGVYGWHIDHIKPLASFDLTDRNQLLDACHYTNLQPLWAKDNLSKKDKLLSI